MRQTKIPSFQVVQELPADPTKRSCFEILPIVVLGIAMLFGAGCGSPTMVEGGDYGSGVNASGSIARSKFAGRYVCRYECRPAVIDLGSARLRFDEVWLEKNFVTDRNLPIFLRRKVPLGYLLVQRVADGESESVLRNNYDRRITVEPEPEVSATLIGSRYCSVSRLREPPAVVRITEEIHLDGQKIRYEYELHRVEDAP